jgi:probable rRNA maturation factor
MAPRAITIVLNDEYKKLLVSALRLKRMLRQLCLRFEIEKAVIGIALVDDDGIVSVNRSFLKSRKRTDVISFDLSDDAGRRVFDIVVNGQRARREAKARGHSAETELVLYIVHGFLHNVGYDDRTEKAARRMHAMEDEILQEFRYGRPYASPCRAKKGKIRS